MPHLELLLPLLTARGQGGLSEDNGQVKGNTLHGHIIRGIADDDPKKLYYRQTFLDAAQLANIVMGLPYVDEKKVGAYGGSQGGALALACAALEPRMNRIAPMFPFLSDYRKVCGMEVYPEPYEELQEYFRNFDPRHEYEEEFFHKLGYIDVQNLAHRIQAKVKMFTALHDVICPPITQFAAYNKIPGNKKSVVLYPEYGHEMLPGYLDEMLQYMQEMIHEKPDGP